MGGVGAELDPLIGLNNARTPLRSRLLSVPSLRQRYLQHVRTIAEESLDWNKLGPVVEQYRSLIESEVEADTRKLESFAAFKNALADDSAEARPIERRSSPSLRAFVEQRRDYLLNHPEIKKIAP